MTSLDKPKKKKTVSQHLWSMHWWMAFIYIPVFAIGKYMTDVDNSVSYKGSLYDFHKSLGIFTMILLTGRIFLLLRKLQQHKPPARRPLSKFERFRTVALHSLLYVFMFIVPLSGWISSNLYKSNNVRLFFIPLPDIVQSSKELLEVGESVHFWLSYTFLAFVILHAIDQWKFLKATGRRFFKFMLKKIAVSG